jgi:hypothetical protein
MTHPPTTTESYEGTIPSGPFQLPYIVEGAGQPAIVIGSARYYQRAFSQGLRNHLRLLFTDHRGFAPSPGQVDRSEFELHKFKNLTVRLFDRSGHTPQFEEPQSFDEELVNWIHATSPTVSPIC